MSLLASLRQLSEALLNRNSSEALSLAVENLHTSLKETFHEKESVPPQVSSQVPAPDAAASQGSGTPDASNPAASA